MEEENAVELLQRYRRDRRILLDFILAGSLMKKVIMPPGAVTLDDVDLDQVSVDYVLNCAKKGGMLELSEAIRDYHDHTGLPQMNSTGSAGEFFLVTNPEFSGSPPKRAPPPVPDFVPPPVLTPPPGVFSSIPDLDSSPVASSVSKSESFNYTQAQELTVDDIEDFEDDDIDEADSLRISRRIRNDATDLSLGLPSFKTGELQRTECLRSLREIASPLAERPARGDLTGEVCHWADGYHLNIRLYEKLLLSVFDMLDGGKLTEVSTFGSLPWQHGSVKIYKRTAFIYIAKSLSA
ncbi:unnamed protein product [Prunus armeniaca]|uniref:Uncharacterized protein n=1 Tax=Prunus armeniaca TaxID=36596 RepID=A0A6J5WAT3_PRUAR|nr:unnamed protein product [Prunus armeniaca]CAB4298709.1 unnamed protein product [Prunus armeniaca]